MRKANIEDIQNLGEDLKDSVILIHLFDQLDPGKGHIDALEAGTNLEKAAILV